MKGDHCIKYWSKTQSGIVLSTAEAELVALVKGVSEAKGVAAIWKDMTGRDMGAIGVYTDASAAIALPEGLSPSRLHTGALTHVQFVDGSRMEKVFSDSFNDDKVSNYLRSSISD